MCSDLLLAYHIAVWNLTLNVLNSIEGVCIYSELLELFNPSHEFQKYILYVRLLKKEKYVGMFVQINLFQVLDVLEHFS